MVNYKGNHCSAGYYCPAGSTSATQVACPPGTYSDATDIHDPRDCLVCPQGYQCDEATTTANGKMKLCDEHYFCVEGTQYTSNIAAQLTANQAQWEFALTARNQPPMPCPAGTYAPFQGAKTMEDCVICPAGSYCNKGIEVCPAGHYCPMHTEYATQYPCPTGYYVSNTGAKSKQECLTCKVGHFCEEGAVEQTPCPVGTYNGKSNTESKCTPCPAGSFCHKTGMVEPVICPAGCWSEASAGICSECPAGHFCPNSGMTLLDIKRNFKCAAGLKCIFAMGDADVYSCSHIDAGTTYSS
jgi:hypothetical protein